MLNLSQTLASMYVQDLSKVNVHMVSLERKQLKNEKCRLFHPKRCYRYMAFYTHETKGCIKGVLHINLCKSSVDTKKCSDVSCSAMHLKGTKRPKSMWKRTDKPGKQKNGISKVQVSSRQDGRTDGNQTKPGSKNTSKKKIDSKKDSTADNSSSFLGITSRLEELKTSMMETVQREMSAVRTEVGQFKQQLDALKLAMTPHQASHNPAMAYCGLFKPTPYEMPPYNPAWMQRDRMPRQTMTHIPPAFC
jgi:hypothetical protein